MRSLQVNEEAADGKGSGLNWTDQRRGFVANMGLGASVIGKLLHRRKLGFKGLVRLSRAAVVDFFCHYYIHFFHVHWVEFSELISFKHLAFRNDFSLVVLCE